jgi:hypothetical protein
MSLSDTMLPSISGLTKYKPCHNKQIIAEHIFMKLVRRFSHCRLEQTGATTFQAISNSNVTDEQNRDVGG